MKLSIINKNNQALDLINSRDKFILSAVNGLHGIDTSIATSETPYTDGANVENIKALPRGIDLTFTLRGDIKASREYITSIVKSKQTVTIKEVTDKREITIKGFVTVPPYTHMERTSKLTISVYCPQPYWEDLNYIIETISEYIDLLHFPREGQYFTETGKPFGAIDTSSTKTFENKSDTSVGMVISIVALGEVSTPRISCSTGEQNGWYMQLNVTLQANDEIEINTEKTKKSITINGSDLYNGVDILNYLEWKGNDWLQLETGKNAFSVSTDGGSGNVYYSLIFKGRYE